MSMVLSYCERGKFRELL